MRARVAMAVVAGAVLVLAGAACGGGDDGASSTAAPASTTLQGPVWQWQGSQYNNDTKATPDDPSRYTIRFADDGTVSIRADCNQVGGTFEADQGSLTITLGPSTLKACPEDSLDSEYLRDLQGAAGYLFGDAGQLHIDIKFDTGTMTFASAPS